MQVNQNPLRSEINQMFAELTDENITLSDVPSIDNENDPVDYISTRLTFQSDDNDRYGHYTRYN